MNKRFNQISDWHLTELGKSHITLYMGIQTSLNKVLKINLASMHLGQFPNGETEVQILENVQGRDVFVLQSIARQTNHDFKNLFFSFFFQ